MVRYKFVKCSYFDEDKNFWVVDAWKDPDVSEESESVAVIHQSGDAYIFPNGIGCENVERCVADKVAEIKKSGMTFGEDCEVVDVRLTKQEHPNAYNTKVEELVSAGMTREEAEDFLLMPFCMEVFYSGDRGLFAVESDALECTPIYDPYTGIKMREE